MSGKKYDLSIVGKSSAFPSITSKYKILILSVLAVLVVGIVCLAVGIILISSRDENSSTMESKPDHDKTDLEYDECSPSEESKRSGFEQFLRKVQKANYEEYPYLYASKKGITRDEFNKNFRAFDPRPMNIKKTTDRAKRLLSEMKSLGINIHQLKPREKKALSQVEHFLQHIFGVPYESNYYAGDFMLGPNSFCYQKICSVGYDIHNALSKVKPRSLSDMEIIKSILRMHKQGIEQYTRNLKLGVKTGMVRSQEDCIASYEVLKRPYLNIVKQGQIGILDVWFAKSFHKDTYFSDLSKEDKDKWKKDNGEVITDFMKKLLNETIGKALDEFLSYYSDEHMHHCLPSDVSSGLASLPVDYVYFDGKPNTSLPTNKTLPFGERLNGSKSYEMILSFFTTNNMTAPEINKLGEDMIAILYPQMEQVARKYTKQNNTATAKEEFLKELNTSSTMFFNEKPFPEIESNGTAHGRCTSPSKAKQHCPQRWKALQAWRDHALKVMSFLDAKTFSMFHFSGEYITTPGCPLKVKPEFLASRSVPTYSASNKGCHSPATFNIPFFLSNLGPRYMEYTISAHEARPGHHTQIQGSREHFGDSCAADVISWLGKQTLYNAFVEGWALYCEYPLIAEDTDAYSDDVLMHYGMLKSQVWRAVRLIVDTNLHYYGKTRKDALKVFEDYMWDTGDQAQKEVTRYQSVPGQALSYMIGQLQIMKLRNYTEEKLGSKFNLRDFHYQVLSQGASPLSYLENHIKKYVSCTLNKEESGCEYITRSPSEKMMDSRVRRAHVDQTAFVEATDKNHEKNWPLEPTQEFIF